MNKFKIMTIVGTRPEIIRLSEIIKLLDKCFNHVLVHTGQNWDYTLNQIFFEQLNLRAPDYYLNCGASSLGETLGNIISKSYDLLIQEQPDALLILGDTNSALSAINAKRLKIPIFHMEAGNRCFDQNVPEEINRKIIDHIADINLPYTEHARRYLIAEGIRPDHIFVTGSPLKQVLATHLEAIEQSSILTQLKLTPSQYILVSAHREENIDDEKHFLTLMSSLNNIASHYNLPIIYSTHPRSQKFITSRQFVFDSNIQTLTPLGFLDYNKLQQNAYCVLSDSGTLSEESALLNFPAVLIRNSTERPEVLDKGTIVIGNRSTSSIIQSIDLARMLYTTTSFIPPDYTDCNVSIKIAKLIQSYIPIINEFIWRKY